MPVMTEAEAVAKLRNICAADAEPALSNDDLLECLEENRRGTPWTADTAFAYGQIVVPTAANANGRRYRCTRAGSSGATEPIWPRFAWAQHSGQRFADGDTTDDSAAHWEDAGPAFPGLWDISGAARAAWLRKAAKDAMLIDFSDAGEKIQLTQRRDFANKQAAKYCAVVIR